MKALIAMSLIVGSIVGSQAQAEKISCSAVQFRMKGWSTAKAKVTLSMNYWQNGSRYFITNVVGTVRASTDNDLSNSGAYVGLFRLNNIISDNASYNPTAYEQSVQFKKVDATQTIGLENGMWGNLVIAKKAKRGKYEAHYIFQAGDHMGGTIDMTCSTKASIRM